MLHTLGMFQEEFSDTSRQWTGSNSNRYISVGGSNSRSSSPHRRVLQSHHIYHQPHLRVQIPGALTMVSRNGTIGLLAEISTFANLSLKSFTQRYHESTHPMWEKGRGGGIPQNAIPPP